MSDLDENFTRRARELFLASTGSLEPKVLGRLAEARRRAVEVADMPRWRHAVAGWRLPAGAVALLFVAVVGGLLLNHGLGTTPASPFSAANTDAPLIMTSDNLDMYADLDFYQWMETQDQPVAVPAADTVDDTDTDDDGDTGTGG